MWVLNNKTYLYIHFHFSHLWLSPGWRRLKLSQGLAFDPLHRQFMAKHYLLSSFIPHSLLEHFTFRPRRFRIVSVSSYRYSWLLCTSKLGTKSHMQGSSIIAPQLTTSYFGDWKFEVTVLAFVPNLYFLKFQVEIVYFQSGNAVEDHYV